MKPATTEKVYVHAGPDRLEIGWEHPVGRVPGHCLEWEVERRLEGPDGKNTSVIVSALSLCRVCATYNTCICVKSDILNSVKHELASFDMQASCQRGGFKNPPTCKHKVGVGVMGILAAKHIYWIFVAVIHH